MKFMWKGQEMYIDGYLASALDSIAYNIKNDWDFVILITGDRTVRTGKSVIGGTVCAYLAFRLSKLGFPTTYGLDDVYFDNKEMMEAAFNKPKYSINHYDEGREGLASSKWASQLQQDLLDFFAECGQLNQLFVIVAPDFFGLKEDIAVARSECLINVYRKEIKAFAKMNDGGEDKPVVKFQRGFFEFFNRKSKRKLFDFARTTKRKDYGVVKADFIGKFTNQYPFDEQAYRDKKREALSRFNERKTAEEEQRRDKFAQKVAIVTQKLKERGYTDIEIGDILDCSRGTVARWKKMGVSKPENSLLT